ncbi:MAG: M20 family peptidase [Gammaproteobacteria bacterium]|nr:M20 family peptidase [Gammaproteobacteria bacterium]
MRSVPIWKKFLKLVASLIGLLLALIIFNTLQYPSRQLETAPANTEIDKIGQLPQMLSKVIRFETYSKRAPEPYDAHPFDQLHTFLKEVFPLVYEKLQVEVINQHGLLFTWKGKNPDLTPVLFVAHQDVVSVEEPQTWEHPPFSGKIHDGYVWGRGALDDKPAIITQMYNIQELLKQSWQPERTLVFAYGQDEEVGGEYGATQLAAELKKRGYHFDAIYDEGMPITQGILAGIDSPVALVGIAEKGYMTLTLSVNGEGGHSSSPPPNTAVGVLAHAIAKLEDHPMSASLDGPVGHMFSTLAPEMGTVKHAVLSNLWLLGGVLEKQLAGKPSTNALIRTTVAATMFQGSQQANVLPQLAEAKVNFRLIPENSIEQVIQHVKDTIKDERVNIEIFGDASEPSAVSSIESNAYMALNRSIRESFPDAMVAPTLMIGATDSRRYKDLADNIYRFRPLLLNAQDIKRFHGSNERISIANLRQMAVFYRQLFQHIGGKSE